MTYKEITVGEKMGAGGESLSTFSLFHVGGGGGGGLNPLTNLVTVYQK